MPSCFVWEAMSQTDRSEVSFEDWKNHDQKRANPGFTHRLATALRPGIVDRLRTEQHRHRSDAGEGVVTAN
jgi:hypothetical protein